MPEIVADIVPGVAGSNPHDFANVNGTLFFSARNAANGYELWKSDGTAAGTSLVKNIRPGFNGSYPTSLTNVSGTLFFSANDGTNGVELWQSDGTDSGTTLVKNINAGTVSSQPASLVNLNGTLFFSANDGMNGYQLWQSDGTAAGTTLAIVIRTDGRYSIPRSLTNVNGTLFFTAEDGITGYELWRSDGTQASTSLVKDINAGFGYSNPDQLTNVNGTLFFRANDGTQGDELWQSDGTDGGTSVVKDIFPGSDSSFPGFLANVNGTLYFSANDGTYGIELWKSDGTSTGTVLVKDITPGNYSSEPQYLANVNGTLYFRANRSTLPYELWQSDGTAVGTEMTADINPGSDGSFVHPLTNVNGTLFFGATDGSVGLELWKLVPNAPPIATSSSVTTNEDVAFSFSVSDFQFTDDESDSLVSMTVTNLTLATGDILTVNQGAGVVTVTNGMTILAAEIPSLTYTPAADASGTARSTIDFTVNDAGLGTVAATMTISVIAIADTPSVTNASTAVNEQSTSGLVISANPVDGAEVTHFKITGIANGSLFQNDGSTPVNDGDFITAADGSAGLKFTPLMDFVGAGHFTIQASKSSVVGGLGGTVVVADITVTGLTLGNTVWIDGNGSKTYEVGTDFVGAFVFLTLFQADGTTVVTTGATDANGMYTFTDLVPGDYIVRVDASNFSSGQPLAGLFSIFGSTDPDDNINHDDNGVDDADPATNGIRSLPITLAPGTEPTDARNNTNNSLDFGFALLAPGLNPVSFIQGSQPTLTWQPTPEAATYEIWFSRTFPSVARVYLDSSISTTEWTPPADLPAGFYRYWVRALDAVGHSSAWSAFNEFQVRPTLVSPIAGTFIDMPTFEWNAIPFASSYELFLRTSNGVQTITGISVNTYTPTTALPQNGLVQWWIRATGSPGNGGWSYAGDAKSTPQPVITGPASPGSLTPTITWTKVPGSGRYILHVENVNNPGVAVIREDNLSNSNFTPSTPLAAGTYRAWVKAIDAMTDSFSDGLWSLRPFNFTVAASSADTMYDLLNAGDLIPAALPLQQSSVVVQTSEHRSRPGSTDKTKGATDAVATQVDFSAESNQEQADAFDVDWIMQQFAMEGFPDLAAIDMP